MGHVKEIFKTIPKSLEWRSFYRHDLPLLMDFCQEVWDLSDQHNLNKTQTKALAKLKKLSESQRRDALECS